MRGPTMAFLSIGTTGFLAGLGRMHARVSSPKTPAKTTTVTV